MTTKPILFNSAMVCAILDGQKSMTRRIADFGDCANHHVQPMRSKSGQNGVWCFDCNTWVKAKIPFQPGDLLWVRETWAHYQTVNYVLRPDGRSYSEASDGYAGYRADGHDTIEDFRDHVRLMSGYDLENVLIYNDNWRPSIHMPKWAARLFLRVKAVRAERLLDISEADVLAEGMGNDDQFECAQDELKALFYDLYPQLLGKNPWLWVTTFGRVEKPRGWPNLAEEKEVA